MNIRFGLRNEAFKLRTADRWAYDPKTIDGYGTSLSLCAARGDTAAFQAVVWCDGEYALNVGQAAWFSQMCRGRMPVLRLEARCQLENALYIEDMLPDNDGTPTADALLTSPVVELRCEETRAVWCEIKIPKDTPAGNYRLTLTLYSGFMFESESVVGTAEVDVEVLDYVMPEPSEYRMYLDLWLHCCNIARKHETVLWSDEHFEVIERYVKTLAELGQKSAICIVSEIPWSGQSTFYDMTTAANLYEYSIVSVTRTDGGFEYDFTAMQRYIDLCAKYGICGDISLYGLANVWTFNDYGYGGVAPDYPDALRIRYRDARDGCYKYMDNAADIDAYIKAIEQYFISTGQIDRVRLAADEPGDIEAYRKSIGHLLELAPSFRLKAAINHAEFIGEFADEVCDFVPYIRCLSQEYDKVIEYKRTMEGKRFLWYVCCGPDFINTFLSSDLCESYFIGVLTSYAGLDGFLRWNYTVWPDDARKVTTVGHWKAGDYNFVYPQNNGYPLLTIRWKALKRGIELFELLERLKDLGDKSALDEAYGMVVREKDIRTYFNGHRSAAQLCSLEYEDYARLRRFVIERLIKNR